MQRGGPFDQIIFGEVFNIDLLKVVLPVTQVGKENRQHIFPGFLFWSPFAIRVLVNTTSYQGFFGRIHGYQWFYQCDMVAVCVYNKVNIVGQSYTIGD